MYKIYLGINDGEEGFIIPVLPEKISIKQSGDNKTYNVINLGEVNKINLPKLTTISFESHFPLKESSFVSVTKKKLKKPKVYIKKINEWRNNLSKIRFIFTGGPIVINDLFSIEDFSFEEHGGEVGDIYYSIELKKYKEYSAKKIIPIVPVATSIPIFIPASNTTVPPAGNSDTQRTYTVVSGDTLWGIAKRFLGDGSRYPEIASLNSISNPDLIYPGQVFTIPAS